MHEPKITIITVCYNSEKYIELAIKSVLRQTYQNLEYIIVDGGSTDSTLKIVDKYKDRITKIISEKDRGISDAFNKGIKVATGEIIGIVNSDDMLADETVISKVAQYYDPAIDIYRGSEIVKNYDTGYEYILKPTLRFTQNPVLFHVCHMATYIKRDAFAKFGFYNIQFKYAMDLELLYRFERLGAKSKEIDVVVGIFRLGGVSQTYNKCKRNECKKIIKENGGKKADILAYSICLFIKDYLRKGLNLFSIDLASKIRYGGKNESFT